MNQPFLYQAERLSDGKIVTGSLLHVPDSPFAYIATTEAMNSMIVDELNNGAVSKLNLTRVMLKSIRPLENKEQKGIHHNEWEKYTVLIVNEIFPKDNMLIIKSEGSRHVQYFKERIDETLLKERFQTLDINKEECEIIYVGRTWGNKELIIDKVIGL